MCPVGLRLKEPTTTTHGNMGIPGIAFFRSGVEDRRGVPVSFACRGVASGDQGLAFSMEAPDVLGLTLA